MTVVAGSAPDTRTIRVRIVGMGRAGGALLRALQGTPLVILLDQMGRNDDLVHAGKDADIVLLAVTDGSIAEVAGIVAPLPDTVVAHLSGACTLDVLAPHARRASLHPLVPISDSETGAESLRGAWMTVAGDPLIERLAAALDAKLVRIADEDRVRYHAAATMASNHLVALLGQVARVAESVGVPLEALLDLSTTALANTRAHGPAKALTGPVSRGDYDTVRAHIGALPHEERTAYIAMAERAARLLDQLLPEDIRV